MITSQGKVMSMDYHGGNKQDIFARHSFNSYLLGILGNSLFLEHRSTSDVIEVELISMTQSKLEISAIETDDMNRVLFIDKARQPKGKIQTGNAGFDFRSHFLNKIHQFVVSGRYCGAVQHRLVTTNFSRDNSLCRIVEKGMK